MSSATCRRGRKLPGDLLDGRHEIGRYGHPEPFLGGGRTDREEGQKEQRDRKKKKDRGSLHGYHLLCFTRYMLRLAQYRNQSGMSRLFLRHEGNIL